MNIQKEMKKILERRALHAIGNKCIPSEKLSGSYLHEDLLGHKIDVPFIVYRYVDGYEERVEQWPDEIILYEDGNFAGGWNIDTNGEICWG